MLESGCLDQFDKKKISLQTNSKSFGRNDVLDYFAKDNLIDNEYLKR